MPYAIGAWSSRYSAPTTSPSSGSRTSRYWNRAEAPHLVLELAAPHEVPDVPQVVDRDFDVQADPRHVDQVQVRHHAEQGEPAYPAGVAAGDRPPAVGPDQPGDAGQRQHRHEVVSEREGVDRQPGEQPAVAGAQPPLRQARRDRREEQDVQRVDLGDRRLRPEGGADRERERGGGGHRAAHVEDPQQAEQHGHGDGPEDRRQEVGAPRRCAEGHDVAPGLDERDPDGLAGGVGDASGHAHVLPFGHVTAVSDPGQQRPGVDGEGQAGDARGQGTVASSLDVGIADGPRRPGADAARGDLGGVDELGRRSRGVRRSHGGPKR